MADCKRKTANLFNISLTQGVWAGNVGESPYVSPSTRRICTSNIINLDTTKTYTVAPRQPDMYVVVKILDSNGNIVSDSGWKSSVTFSNAYGIVATFRFINESETSPQDFMGAMLNTGSTPLPYEPYGWVHSLRKLGTSTDTITTLSVDIYADGNNATVGISGNTVQSGTPTPDNPIMPEGTGDRTTNEWNVTILPNSAITEDSKWQKYDSSVVSTTMYMSCEANTTYYLYTPSSITSGIFRVYTSTSNEIPIVGSYSITVYEKIRSSSPISVFKFTTGANDKMIIVQVTTANSQTMADNAILDRGYKIPISSNSTTTPVYLGEVESTRRIYKLVLTGQESWNANSTGNTQFFYTTVSNETIQNSEIICTHFENANIGQTTTVVGIGFAGMVQLRVRPENTSAETAISFKQWLEQQYAAGTPVTIWYVLATETTGIVNEPIRKIGDYADTVSGITVPTITGKDTFDVGTTLKPSEVSLSYTGWHDATVEEWDGSQWNE